MRSFSWVLCFITLYFFSIALFCFTEMTKEWGDFFNLCSNGISLLMAYCAIKRKLNHLEYQAIMFVFIYKAFSMFYLAIGYATGSVEWMNQNIFFICAIGISGFLAWFLSNVFKKRKHELQIT